MLALPDALAPLLAYKQFIVCRFSPDLSKPGKTLKQPIDYRTGRMTAKGNGGAHDPAIWIDGATACALATAWGSSPDANGVHYGVGFVFTVNDPFFFIDIDNCLDPVSRTWTPIVAELTAALPGAAVEVSQSGRGLHIIGVGRAPMHPTERSCKDHTGQLWDLYTDDRFVALTGNGIVGHAANADHSHALYALSAKWLPPKAATSGPAPDWTVGPVDEWHGPTDDAQLVERAMRSSSARAAFGKAASFADLWTCNLDALATAYPPDPNGTLPYNASTADMALFQHLMFWTGKDCERVKRLALSSALARDKWERDEYIDGTILKCLTLQRDVLTDKMPEPLAGAAALPGDDGTGVTPVGEPPVPVLVTGVTILGVENQLDTFKGCVYVVDANRALTPGGILLKSDQFRVMYGGYTFMMGGEADRSTRDAWEAFTQSQGFRCPRADSTCFKPDRAPGEIVREAGRARVNTWWPIETPRKVGDPSRFLLHLSKLLPNERDQQIILSYMAACVQHKGKKFKWAPLLQGVEGNGKTLMSLCVAEAVGRRYSHWPRADQITEKFNSWLFDKVFIGVEDIYVPEHKEDVIEVLKPMITGENLSKRAMNTDQVDSDVCCNFMLNSNHKNAVKKTRKDRRFAVFYTAQQEAGDLVRDGMGGDYFESLYEWMRAEGFAIVSELLHTYPIPAHFNPATKCQRAPETSSTEQVIENSLGGVEQEVMEAIAQGLPGFAGGWVSSMALDRLLDKLSASRRIPHNKRRELLQQLGYDWHPGLPDGRVNNLLLPDNGKPRLFVKPGHAAIGIPSVAEIAKAYTVAQAPSVPTIA